MSDRRTFKRRTILKSIGVSGAAAAGSSQTGAASENSNISISDLTGGSKKGVLGRANKNSEFRKIRSEFKKDGWKLNRKQSEVSEIHNEDSALSYNLVVARFERKKQKHENEQRYITWTDLDLDRLDLQEDLYRVSGHQFKQIEAANWEVSKSTVKGRSVSTDTEEINVADEFSASSGFSISSSSSCNGWNECYRAKTTCDSYNWSCILKTAGASVTTIAACGSCIFASPSCLYCLGAILTTSGISVGCDYGNNCTTTYECTTSCND